MERLKIVLPWLFFALCAAGYFLFAIDLQRTEHALLLSAFGSLVLISLLLFRQLQHKAWWWLFGAGLVFRLLFLTATPLLSDDFYRFTWDGELSRDGYGVFAFTPKEYPAHMRAEDQEKYEALLNAHSEAFPDGMNSKGYYSIYPAVNQLAFYTATFGGDPNGKNLIILRLWILIGEIVSFFALKALLTSRKQTYMLGIYWLHPLVIIELTGNLHFEALAICFTLLALYSAWKNKWFAVAVSAALAIMSKLTPIFILAALYKKQSLKTWLLTGTTAGILTLLLLGTIMTPETFWNFKRSFGLFFAHFSFNSGLYYGMIDLASLLTWRPMAGTFSLVFPFITIAIFLYLTFRSKQDLYTTLLLLFTIYFLFSPIVHPWYVTILIPLAVLTEKIYPIVWSILIFGTYVAYGETFAHPFLWIYIEYALVIVLMIQEFRTTRNWAHRLAGIFYSSIPKTVK